MSRACVEVERPRMPGRVTAKRRIPISARIPFGMARNSRRTPSWPELVLKLLLGLMFLSLAVLDGTRFADQVASHGDRLMTVASA